MSGLILGTAGHIDHGKTTLVRALTGVDTDRLKEEKARGITIELGFAELKREGLPRLGVVDVPGHEEFVRAMLAGAAGMDMVLLVVAADEGVMPQTREHLSIVRLLGVPELVVAYTKCDLVEPEWLALVEEDVDSLLDETPYQSASRVRTSAATGEGVEELVGALADAARRVPERSGDDLVRLPLDRVFTIQGTGTVVTGTLWSGTLRTGDRVRILPDDLEARVRGVQVHGAPAEETPAGARTAAALTGPGADRDIIERGATLVTGSAWSPTWMLTVRMRLLFDSEWMLEHNQRVHVHHGTSQVPARCSLLEGVPMGPGDAAWIQLRLERPLVARGRDRVVVRSYSPVTTIGGGRIAESHPPKRRGADPEIAARLSEVLDAPPARAIHALLEIAGGVGLDPDEIPIRSGFTPSQTEAALEDLRTEGVRTAGGRVFSAATWRSAREIVLEAVGAGHESDPLRTAVPRAAVRSALPGSAPAGMADGVIEELLQNGTLEEREGGLALPGHEPRMTSEQKRVCEVVTELITGAGLAPPFLDELPEPLRVRPDLWSILRWQEREGWLIQVADNLYVGVEPVREAERRVAEVLGGRTGLGPADFREVLDVTRKHLIPLLNFFDTRGVTVRLPDGRSVG